MNRIIQALPLLFAFAAHAQTGAAEQPVESVGPFAIGVFGVLFFGAIAAYFWLTWRGEQKAKRTGIDGPKGAGGS